MESLYHQLARYGRRGSEFQHIDVKSGEIVMLDDQSGNNLKPRMYMKIFKSDYEHHAQIYTDSGYTLMYGCISLRRCKVEMDEDKPVICITGTELVTSTKMKKASIMSFEAQSLSDAREWVKYLSPDKGLPAASELSPRVSRGRKVLRGSARRIRTRDN